MIPPAGVLLFTFRVHLFYLLIVLLFRISALMHALKNITVAETIDTDRIAR